MTSPTYEQLQQLALACETRDELDTQVITKYGEAYLDRARLVAVYACGHRWVFGEDLSPPSDAYLIRRALKRPTSVVLIVASTLVLLLMACPPFTVTPQMGMSIYTGHRWLFDAHGEGGSPGTINLGFLALELLAVFTVGAAAYVIATKLERALGISISKSFIK